MKQLSLFDLLGEEPVVVTPTPEPEPVVKPTERPQWQRNNWQLEQYYKPLPDVTDPEEIILFTSHCPVIKGNHRQYNCCAYSVKVRFGDLDPDAIYCRFPGGAWGPKEPIPCAYCAEKIVDFLIKLIQ